MMPESTLPAPPASPESVEFVAAAKEGRFLIRRCTACGKPHWYPARSARSVSAKRYGSTRPAAARSTVSARCAGSIRRTRLPMSR